MKQEVIVHVSPISDSDHVWVLIPHRFFMHPNLAACIEKAVKHTQKKSELGEEESHD